MKTQSVPSTPSPKPVGDGVAEFPVAPGSCFAVPGPKVCRIMAFWAIFKRFGPLFYLLWGFRLAYRQHRVRVPTVGRMPSPEHSNKIHPPMGSALPVQWINPEGLCTQ